MIKNNNKPSSSDNTIKVLKPAIIKGSVALLLLIALVVTYILLPADLKGQGISTEQNGEELYLLEGEVKASTRGIFLFPQTTSSMLQSILVENTNGTFKLNRSEEAGSFYLNDNKQITYKDEAFASLIVATGNTITNDRVYPDLYTGEGPEIINYHSFGLSEDTMSGRYTLTTIEGQKYTVRVGNPVPSGDGYYACLEGREAVYILASDLQNTVLGTVENIVTPTLGIQNYDEVDDNNSTSSGTIDHFTLWNKSQHVATIHSAKANDPVLINNLYNFAMACKQSVTVDELLACKDLKELENVIGTSAIPYAYVPDTDNYNAICGLLPTLVGDETVAIKDGKTGTITDEQLKKFGIDKDDPAHEIFYSYSGANGSLSYNHLIISELTDGFYYVYSNLNSVIAKVSKDTLYFLEWDYDMWVEPAFFQEYITAISEIKIKTTAADYTYKLHHTADSEGTAVLNVSLGDKKLDSENFRRFYRVLLSRKLRGAYSGEAPGEDTLYLTFTVTTNKGKTTEYKFYKASTQQAYLTINGKGEFYCLMSEVRKLEKDAAKLAAGEDVDYEAWS